VSAAAAVTGTLTGTSRPQALTTGYNVGMAIAAGLTLLALLIAVTVIRAPRRGPRPVQPTTLGESVTEKA
jgi:hypothetical protein